MVHVCMAAVLRNHDPPVDNKESGNTKWQKKKNMSLRAAEFSPWVGRFKDNSKELTQLIVVLMPGEPSLKCLETDWLGLCRLQVPMGGGSQLPMEGLVGTWCAHGPSCDWGQLRTPRPWPWGFCLCPALQPFLLHFLPFSAPHSWGKLFLSPLQSLSLCPPPFSGHSEGSYLWGELPPVWTSVLGGISGQAPPEPSVDSARCVQNSARPKGQRMKVGSGTWVG